MPTPPRPLTQRRILLAEAIATGMTRKKAAEFCGLTEKGVDLAMRSPLVQAEVARRTAEITRETRGRLRSVRNLAIKALATVAGDESAPPSSRVSAATAILDRIGVGKVETVEIVQDHEQGDPEARIARLASRLGSALTMIPDASDDEHEDGDEDGDV